MAEGDIARRPEPAWFPAAAMDFAPDLLVSRACLGGTALAAAANSASHRRRCARGVAERWSNWCPAAGRRRCYPRRRRPHSGRPSCRAPSTAAAAAAVAAGQVGEECRRGWGRRSDSRLAPLTSSSPCDSARPQDGQPHAIFATHCNANTLMPTQCCVARCASALPLFVLTSHETLQSSLPSPPLAREKMRSYVSRTSRGSDSAPALVWQSELPR